MPNANVLVVDDNDILRRLLVEYLKSRSYVAIHGARDGVEALHEVLQRAYAVVILDLMMPKMSGIDVLDAINAHTADPSLRPFEDPPAIVVITSATDHDAPTEAILKRSPLVRAVLRKPLRLEELASHVEGYLRPKNPSS